MSKAKNIYQSTNFKYSLLLFIGVIFSSISLFAQQDVLLHRNLATDSTSLSHVAVLDSTYIHSNSVFLPSNNNYYSLLDSIKDHVVVENNDFISWMNFMNRVSEENGLESQASAFKKTRPVWVVFVLLLLCVSLGVIRIFFRSNFQNILHGFYNDRVFLQVSKEDNLGTSWSYIFLYIIFSFSLGLFISIYQTALGVIDNLNPLDFLKASLYVGVLFVVKILLIRFISQIFEVGKIAREYIAVLYLVYFNSALILIPILIFVTFLPVYYFKFILIFYTVIVFGLFVYRFFKTAGSLLGQLKFSIFYLILYLCTLEIAPILILMKYLTK